MKTNLFAVFLLLPVALSLGCAATYKDQINQQLWLRELRLMDAATMAKVRQNPAMATERLKADKILNFLPENEAIALYSTAG